MLKEWVAYRKSYVSVGDGEGQELKREASEERRLACSSHWKKSIKAALQWVCGGVEQSTREDSRDETGRQGQGRGPVAGGPAIHRKDSGPPARAMGGHRLLLKGK